MKPFADFEIPERMAHLPKDERGLPIPYTVWVDTDGKAHFSINDSTKQLECGVHDLCGLCGFRNDEMRWFIGGPISAFHRHGSYIDGPMHDECLHFALKVCPYLALRNYNGRIDDRNVDPNKMGQTTHFVDPTVIPERPEVFVAVCTERSGQESHYIREEGSVGVRYRVKAGAKVEFWKHGEMLDNEEGEKIAKRGLKKHGR